jgi:type IV secretory pathway VirB9-like protein
MKQLWTILIIAVLITATMPAMAQKIETATSDHNQIIHLKTALNHLTVIELREPVIQVATGSQTFKVEWRENRVFVEPTEPDASTNLFIWTASQRLNYELEPAGAVTTMDFAVDQTPIQVIQPKPTTAPTTLANGSVAGRKTRENGVSQARQETGRSCHSRPL